MHILRSRFAHVVLIALIASGALLTAIPRTPPPEVVQNALTPTIALSTTTPTISTSTTPLNETATSTTSTKLQSTEKASIKATESTHTVTTPSPNEIVRVENPYPTPPLQFETINTSARAALVNIYCSTKTTGSLQPITASGIMVSRSGIVLTNAHVAQYVLLSQSGKTDLSCEVRTGAPAVSKWVPVVMYIPSAWIDVHAPEIVQSHVTGTGEHDYSLLAMSQTVDGSPLPSEFSHLSPDAREAIGFVDDNVLVASYPVEFEGGRIIQGDLHSVTSITPIKQLMTFTVGKADALSLGGVIGAQSGSSGGGVVNQWSRLIGLITTTSEGATTGERDLHAITTAYIDRDLRIQTGTGLTATLAKDPKMSSDAFLPEATILGEKLISIIRNR